MKLSKPFISKQGWQLLAAVYAAILLGILGLAYLGKLPLILTQNDKLGHVVLYGIATYLGHRVLSYRQIRLWRWQLPLFPFLFGGFTIAEELAQSLSPNRSLDGVDLIASFTGISLGYWLSERGNLRR